MPVQPPIDVRIYAPTGQRRTVKAISVSAATWRMVRFGGYGDGSFTISGLSTSSLKQSGGNQPVQQNDRIRVFVSGSLRYSGIVTAVSRVKGEPDTLALTTQGFYSIIAPIPLDGRFISPVPVDISQAFRVFAADAQTEYPDLQLNVSSSNIGVSTAVEDVFNKDLGAALSQFTDRLSSVAVFGCDEDETLSGPGRWVDRLFLRSIGNLTTPNYVIPVPGAFRGAAVTLSSGGPDVSRLVNILKITGTNPIYPNYLGEATNGNPGFERPIFNEPTPGGFIRDPSFEPEFAGNNIWVLSGGASFKTASIEGKPQRTGERYLELDDVGETATQTVTADLTAGQTLTIGCFARRENAAFGGTIRIRVQFKNGGLDVGAAIDRHFSPLDIYYKEFSGQFTIPPGTLTGFVVSLSATVSNGTERGIMIDDVYGFIPGLRQDGWEMFALGTAVINSVDWAHTAVKSQGRYSIKVDVSASDANDNDATLLPKGFNKFAVTPGAQLELGGDFRAWDGTSSGKLRLDFFWHDSQGSLIATNQTAIAAGTVTDSWQQVRAIATVPADAAMCLVAITFRGDSQLYIDRLYVRDTIVPMVNGEREWVDSGPFQATFTTGDSNFSTYAFANSITQNGKRFDSIQVDSVNDRVTALAVAVAYFNTYALPMSKPRITLENCPVAFKPGETIRLAGEDGQWLGGTPSPGQPSRAYPIAEIEESVDDAGKVTTTLSLEVEPPSLARLIRELFTEQRQATTGGGSFSSSPVQGGAIPAGITLPLAVDSGGTGATTAANARTNLGLGSGLSVTITTAKLTPAGSDGSMQFVNGILTASTPAT